MRTKKSIAQHDLFAEESGESLGELFNVTDARAKCLEFFAGSGLASEALKTHFKTVWANDNCVKKQVVYRANHNTPFLLDTIENVRGDALPAAQLAWASFPCQDLSLAGNMGGLDAERSGMVWQWLRVIDEMPNAPSILVAENVVGLVSIEGGAHYQRLHRELVKRGYKVGALMLDAVRWLPQSRPRIFVVAVKQDIDTAHLESQEPTWAHSKAVVNAAKGLAAWVWWKLPIPSEEAVSLQSLIEANAATDDDEKQRHLLSMVPANHHKQLKQAEATKVFPGYRRTRKGRQSLELRFDGSAGCLRTPRGGSSRQVLVLREDKQLKTRLLTVRETARLMGAPDTYKLPGSYNDGYMAMGDAVAVPVVRYLAEHLLAPLIESFK